MAPAQDTALLAIGKGGYNIKLAGRISGYDIDVYRESTGTDEEDVDLQEFSDEIEQWILDQLSNIGCDTAKDVLAMDPEELAHRTDLEEETIAEVRRILQAEFDN